MKRFLTPDFYFSHYRELTPQWLIEHGVRYLVLDVDNTLAPYEQPLPDDHNLAWLDSMKQAGIAMVIVSNNHRERIELFASELDIPYFYDAGKPLPKRVRSALAAIGADPSASAAIGDQVYTDVLTARFAGLKYAILVPPIRDKRDLFTRFKRLCEKPVIKAYYRKEKHRE